MSLDPNHEQLLLRLQEQLGGARAMTADRMADTIAHACVRFPALQASAKARVNHLIESRAFTDAALALLELELPQWKLRRLLFEDGAWHCSLSKQPGLPVELDEMAEAGHEVLTLAILSALVEARRRTASADEGIAQSVPQVPRARGHVVCCDNFA
jgi:hypothetical protein